MGDRGLTRGAWVSRLMVGVDEAGYGPLLGPLIVGAATFRIRGECRAFDAFRGSLNHEETGRIRVGDSKAIYASSGLEGLERPVLAFMEAKHGPLPDLPCLLAAAGAAAIPWERYPWYAGEVLTLPRVTPRNRIDEAIRGIESCCHRCDVDWLGLRLRPVLEGEFNERVRGANKAWVLASSASDLLRDSALLGEVGGACHITCDRLGGRKFYSQLLHYVFGCAPTMLVETPTLSSYTLSWRERALHVSYAVKADQTDVAVGLASMACKYVRELFMEMFNRYWTQRAPGVRPTAGYPEDGARFLKEIAGSAPAEMRGILVRSR